MERLTLRKNNIIYINERKNISDCLVKLNEYENIGLSPEDVVYLIERLRCMEKSLLVIQKEFNELKSIR